MKAAIYYIRALLVAALATGAIASVVQTQLNLAELIRLGAPVTFSVRVWTTLEDLARFAPVMAGIAFLALSFAVLAGHWLLRFTPASWRRFVFITASVGGLGFVFWLMRSVIPMPALPGTRTALGHGLMSLTGIVGGWLYARLSAPSVMTAHSSSRGGQWRQAGVVAVLIAAPAMLFFAMAPGTGDTPARVDPTSYKVQTVATGLNRPWSVAFLPDGRVLVTEMEGRLLAIAADGASAQIKLDGLPPIFQQGGTAGLMEVALDPQFEHNGWLYLTMAYGETGANGTRLVRATLANDRIDDVRVLFSSTLKPRAGNNGGRIAFLRDETLMLAVGDGSERREEAQNPANDLGTLVRIDRDGRPSADNPFMGKTDVAPEIYSLGHRNVQGIAVDPTTGDVLITEHGARGGDEVNRIVPGGNYGWPIVTGGIDYPFAKITPFTRLPGYQNALLEWTPSIAPAGLAIYDGPLFPQWQGDLLVPALKERAVRRIVRNGQQIVDQQLLLGELDERMRDVKVAPDGSIYVLTDGVDGRLLRVTP